MVTVLHLGLVLFQVCYLINCQKFNGTPISQKNRQMSAAVLSISTESVQDSFRQADNLISNQTRDIGRNGFSLDIQQNIPAARHQQFQQISQRSIEIEAIQKHFEEATKILTKQFNLTFDQIKFGLTQTDLKSMLEEKEVLERCEASFKFKCREDDRYRTFDGTCNNLINPGWGMSTGCFQRLLDPDYADGISTKRRAISGNPLPAPRRLSLEIHSHMNSPSDYVTRMLMVFGQFLSHDIALIPRSQGPNNKSLDCCPPRGDDPPQCDPILIDRDDRFYSAFEITCLNNVRSSPCPTCTLGPRQQTNLVTAFIDASPIYGNSLDIANSLRNNDGTGTMRFVNVREAGELPPPRSAPDNDFCSSKDPTLKCFETGDRRANQHPALTSMHVVFLRAHNEISRRLRELNRNWDDERIYQESRRIVGAFMQHITYNEFLPVVLGREKMDSLNLTVLRSGYTQYDPAVQPNLFNEFSAAAFRFGHSMVNGYFPRNTGDENAGYKLRNIFQLPFGLYRGEMDGLVGGLLQYPAQNFDRYMVRDLTNHLFQVPGNQSGLDLASLNINRGRDHGVPSYTKLAEFCGGPQITTWKQLKRLFQKGLVPLFRRLYENVQDIDLFPGGLAERPIQGAIVGPTFACIIAIQFYHSKFGDRFFYEHGGQAGSFTPEQLQEIRKMSLGKLICFNSRLNNIQQNVFLYASNSNPVQNCVDLHDMYLRPWSSTE